MAHNPPTRQPRTPRHQQRPLGATTTVLILGNSTPSFNMVSTTEIQARVLTGQLTKASSDIHQAAQNLEKTFQEMNRNATETGSLQIPDPINLIRRMTALEIALSSLQDECATVARKRREVVQNVIEKQCNTVLTVKELLERTENDDPYSSRDEMVDESWESTTRSLEKQASLGRATQTAPLTNKAG